jgi:hypothetical protein
MPALFTARLGSLAEAQATIARILERLGDRAEGFRAPPEPPTTCCGRGCNGCVWEGYFTALNYWREEARARLTPAESPVPG